MKKEKEEIEICKQWYLDYKKRLAENINLYNNDQKEEFFQKVTGYDMDHCAWRYSKIHGAVERMGGFANFRHYVNECAETDYLAFEKLENKIFVLERIVNCTYMHEYKFDGRGYCSKCGWHQPRGN